MHDILEATPGGTRSGPFAGRDPAGLPEEHHLTICTVCSRLLSTRFGSVCFGQPSLGRPMPPNHPSFEEVLRCKNHNKSYVSKAAKHLWAQCLISAIAAVLRCNDELAWLELLMLRKAALCTPNREGKGRHPRMGAETKRRCQNWLEGHRTQLWLRSPRIQRGRNRASQTSRAEPRARTVELVKAELLGKACSSLVNSPPAAITATILAEMREKHPSARAGDSHRMGLLREVHAAVARAADVEALEGQSKASREAPLLVVLACGRNTSRMLLSKAWRTRS